MTHPDIVLVGAGLTVNSCLEASDQLRSEGVEARVLNVINPNSLDEGFENMIAGGNHS